MQFISQKVTNLSYTSLPATYNNYDPLVTYTLETDSNNLTNASVAKFGNYYYRSVINNNLGNTPTENLTTRWVKYSVSNRYAMIDLSSQTKSTVDGSDLIVEFLRGTIESIGLGNFTTSAIVIEQYNAGNGVVSGLTTSISIDLNSTITKGLAFVNAVRIEFVEVSKLFTASKDTYIDIDSTGTLVFTEVANGAVAPALTAPNERLSKVVTDATLIVSVTDLRTVTLVASQSIAYSVNEYVDDYWSYIYSDYSLVIDRGVLINITPLGDTVRITFVKQVVSPFTANCGFMIAGTPQEMGKTLSDISFSFNSFAEKKIDSFGSLTVNKRAVQDLVDFETIIFNTEVPNMKRNIKAIYNDIILFILDPSTDSKYENLLTLGVIETSSVALKSSTNSRIGWSIFESI